MTTTEKISAIVEKHLNLWFQDGVSMPGDGKPPLRERVFDAVQEVLDTIDERELASQLVRAEHDRDGWMEKAIQRGEQLRAMTQARDDAVEAARLLGDELVIYKAKVHGVTL